MAITSMASYPHIETNVIDESIYQYANTRILPLQRDLFMLRAQKGRVGVLAWYDQYIEAENALGAETFNNLNAKYCSNDSIFVKNVMTNNGCFIVRLAEPESIIEASKLESGRHDGITERKGAIKALQILEAVVDSGTQQAGTDVFIYERNDDGSIMVDEDGVRIAYKLDANGNHVEPYELNADKSRVNPDAGYPDNPDWINIADDAAYVAAGSNTPGVAGVKTAKGITIDWRWRYAFIPINADAAHPERETLANMKKYVSGKYTIYPMLVFEAASPGSWGNDNCLEFYYDSSINSRDEAQLLGNVQYTLKPSHKEYGKSSVVSYFDKRGNNGVNFVMEPGKIDARYEQPVSLKDVLDDSYDMANPLPWDVTYFNENWEEVGNLAKNFELKFYQELYDKEDVYFDVPARVLLTSANIGEYVGRTMTLFADATTTTGEVRQVKRSDAQEKDESGVVTREGKYVANAIVHNMPGDGLADSDTDGVPAVDTFKDNRGNVLEYFYMNSEQKSAFAEQSAYYNAVADLVSPWMVNIVSGINLDGYQYNTICVNTTTAYSEADTSTLGTNEDDGTKLYTYKDYKTAELVADVLHYAQNGKDGSLYDWDHETRIRQFLNLTYQYEDTWNPKNIVDRGRFPFNTIFDTGYTLETKKVLCDFLVTREDVKVVLSTQCCNKYLKSNKYEWNDSRNAVMEDPLNTMATDESVGTALQSRVQLMRESIVKGTACCRATIFAHAGHLFGTYKKIVPMTIWSAIKGSEHYNTTSMSGTCKGWPNSQCNIFKDLNWVAPDEASHERHWNIGINYVQYYDMDNLHFPSIRTVYKYDTSVLLDDEFTDAIVFVKQAARDSWATFVGMDTPQVEYESLIVSDLTARLLEIFNGRYTFTVEAYQTEEEKKRGYVQHVAITIWSPAVKRVWLVDVICRRENYDPTTDAAA